MNLELAKVPTLAEIEAALKDMHESGAGEDGLTRNMVLYACEGIQRIFYLIVQEIFARPDACPEEWNWVNMIPLYKNKGVETDLSNYRLI